MQSIGSSNLMENGSFCIVATQTPFKDEKFTIQVDAYDPLALAKPLPQQKPLRQENRLSHR
jgi:hypothetical protein